VNSATRHRCWQSPKAMLGTQLDCRAGSDRAVPSAPLRFTSGAVPHRPGVRAEGQRKHSRAGRPAGERQIRSQERSEKVQRRFEPSNGLAWFDNGHCQGRDGFHRQVSTSEAVIAIRRMRWGSVLSDVIVRGVAVATIRVARAVLRRSPKSLGPGTAMVTGRMVVQRMNGGRRQKIGGKRRDDRNALEITHRPDSEPSSHRPCSHLLRANAQEMGSPNAIELQ